MQVQENVTDFEKLPPGKRGTCEGVGLYEFFKGPAPNKRLVDKRMMKVLVKKLNNKHAHSLVIVGSKPEQHIDDHINTLRMKKMTILEKNLFSFNKIEEAVQNAKISTHHKIYTMKADADAIKYNGYDFIELDLMQTQKTNGDTFIRALREQRNSISKKTLKVFIFTLGYRNGGGNEEVFKFINKMASLVGAEIEGFNGVKNGIPPGVTISDITKSCVYCKENVPTIKMHGRLTDLKCFTYQDEGHGCMISTMFIYR